MSRYAVLKTVRPGPWTDAGEITINVGHVVAIEEEPGCNGQCSRLTLPGGRTVCVRGAYKSVARAIVSQDVGHRRSKRSVSLFEEVFGEGWNARPRRGG